MKKKRSLCAALLAGLMVTAVCLTGCGKKADDNAGGGSSDPDKVYQVGVCQADPARCAGRRYAGLRGCPEYHSRK